MSWTIGSVTLPGDLQWIDEFIPDRHQLETPTMAGGVIVQRSKRVAGTPMTLETPPGVFVTRGQVKSLVQLLDDESTDEITVIHPDSREFTCRFRHGDGLPVDWANLRFRSPPADTDGFHTLTLRLMIV